MPLRFNYSCNFLKDLEFSKIISIKRLDDLLKLFLKIGFFDWSTKNSSWLFINSDEKYQNWLEDELLNFNDCIGQMAHYTTIGSFRAIKASECLGALSLPRETNQGSEFFSKFFAESLAVKISANALPKFVVCIDNNLENLNHFQVACAKAGINFLGILQKNQSVKTGGFNLKDSGDDFVRKGKRRFCVSFV